MQKKDYVQFGLLAISILITTWTALRQHRISKVNLNISLFEKRYKIYENTYNFISEYLIASLSDKSEKRIDLMINFKRNVHQCIFLFDDKVEKYLVKVLDCAEKIYSLKCRNQDYIEEIEWLEKQKIEARDYFKKYMNFKF